MTYVTCPASATTPVVAQQAATLQIIAGGRFTWALAPASR
jgi:alkanesulfonate monooxygenase SsuD/methylene tetrahydromethanopterin reductase-like flavin-dependent oxidoreductase (luciferase family)